MGNAGALERGRRAFARWQWREAYAELSAAERRSQLPAADLQRLASAAYLIGEEPEAVALWKRAHHELLERGETRAAIRCGFLLCLHLLLERQAAESAGWLSRLRRLLEAHGVECAEQGLVRVPLGLLAMHQGDFEGARARFDEAIALAARFGDPDAMALGLLGRGEVSIRNDRIDEGVALLDEAMIGVTAGDVSPILAGIVYCAVILVCQACFDLRRAREWTRALNEWCEAQPELVPFRGRCLVHRSEVLQLQGEWTRALEEIEKACERLAERSEPSVGYAFYQRAELHRLRGELERAEQMYREAGRNGYEPQPGMALLRLAQGELDVATAAMRRAVGEADGAGGLEAMAARARLLGPYVEILLARGDTEAARTAADELGRIAAGNGALALRATAAQARGAVSLARGDAKAALAALREAWTSWQQLEAVYESARVRVLLASACRELGDHDTAELHRDGARSIFERLGAAPDLARLDADPGRRDRGVAGLTRRELQVLGLVAEGRTNRQIASDLGISEHTVARHVSNLFNKIEVSTRTEASAYAFRHALVRQPRGQF